MSSINDPVIQSKSIMNSKYTGSDKTSIRYNSLDRNNYNASELINKNNSTLEIKNQQKDRKIKLVSVTKRLENGI